MTIWHLKVSRKIRTASVSLKNIVNIVKKIKAKRIQISKFNYQLQKLKVPCKKEKNIKTAGEFGLENFPHTHIEFKPTTIAKERTR